MNYLLDKKIKRKRFLRITSVIFVLLLLLYFRAGFFNVFSYAAEGIFHPVLVLGNNIGEKFKNLRSYFISKNSLYLQNQSLQSQLNVDRVQMSNYDSILADNESLKEILGRKDPKINMTVATILAKPNQSLYDTLLVDAGVKQGIKEGNAVFALGDVPIGRVSLVYDNSSKVVLFSSAGERTQAVVSNKNIFMELIGRGGGNFEMVMPKDFTLQKGDQALMPGIRSYVLAIAETIISDSRDPFTKALLTSPVNVQELKFVEVEQ